jgi:hypothetical protein
MTFHSQTVASYDTGDNAPEKNCPRAGVKSERVLPVDEQARTAQELADLQQKLATLPVIEQSKGLLMAHYGIDADTAFAILRRWSSHTNLKLRVISRMLVDAASEPDDAESDDETSQRKHVLSETIQSLQGVHRGDSRAHATCQTFASGSLRKPEVASRQT